MCMCLHALFPMRADFRAFYHHPLKLQDGASYCKQVECFQDDKDDKRQVSEFEHGNTIRSIMFDRSGTMLVTGCEDCKM